MIADVVDRIYHLAHLVDRKTLCSLVSMITPKCNMDCVGTIWLSVGDNRPMLLYNLGCEVNCLLYSFQGGGTDQKIVQESPSSLRKSMIVTSTLGQLQDQRVKK